MLIATWKWTLLRWSAALIAITPVLPFPASAETMKSTFSAEDIRTWNGQPLVRQSERIHGYRGIWFSVGSPGTELEFAL